jgi:hypothetical protein
MKLLPEIAGLITLVLTQGAAGKEYLIGHQRA